MGAAADVAGICGQMRRLKKAAPGWCGFYPVLASGLPVLPGGTGVVLASARVRRLSRLGSDAGVETVGAFEIVGVVGGVGVVGVVGVVVDVGSFQRRMHWDQQQQRQPCLQI